MAAPPPSGLLYTDKPTPMQCPHCQQPITTVVTYENGSKTWIAAILCCFVGCCCIPFCINALKNAVHTCPKCGVVVGVCSK
ncbi:hypothetical protein BV898_00584 [Hypsibius exemplaris]|uniref:LITAF domain-containing protein n=1 Tax=Hypsibius exemplaris TaxID=2072580 RepID=A0A1W0XDV1_HYPEX|nr:hypothetical protein BV898_00584 [Hypsibius exemplaris]